MRKNPQLHARQQADTCTTRSAAASAEATELMLAAKPFSLIDIKLTCYSSEFSCAGCWKDSAGCGHVPDKRVVTRPWATRKDVSTKVCPRRLPRQRLNAARRPFIDWIKTLYHYRIDAEKELECKAVDTHLLAVSRSWDPLPTWADAELVGLLQRWLQLMILS